MPKDTPSAYAGDGRVAGRGGGFDVTAPDGKTYHVLHTVVFRWGVCHGGNLDYIPAPGGPGGQAIGYPTADAAIAALIGPPKR